MAPTLHIRLLGDFSLAIDDIPITTGARLQSLLAYLLLHRTAEQARSHIAFLLWPDSTEAQAHTNLRKLLHQLRQTVPDSHLFLYTTSHSIQWRPADVAWTFDVMQFEKVLSQADDSPTHLQQAIQLYHGDLLPSCYDEWIIPYRDHLRQQFLLAAQHLLTQLEQKRAYENAISIAHRIIQLDPLHEAAYRQLMRLYALHGNRAAALRTYHTCVTTLQRELGTGPSTLTQTIYQSLMQTHTIPDADTSPHADTIPYADAINVVPTPLFGRKAEWQQLQQLWRTAAHTPPHIALLTGEAGIGKTRLAEEMETWVSRQGITTAIAHCYPISPHYAPVASWLRTDALQTAIASLEAHWLTEIARLLPELLTNHPTAITQEWQRQHLFAALTHLFLTVRQPILLLLDDLQWCDNETLQWFHSLLHSHQKPHLLLIATLRTGEILPDHPLITFLNTLQRDHLVTEIPLAPLTSAETTSLAEHIITHPLDVTTRNALYSETEGNPLFIVEMARAGTLAPAPHVASSAQPLLTQAASTLPPTVQAVLATRLAQLTPQARTIAHIAAVIGRSFTFPVLAVASGIDEDTLVQALDELWQRRIIREQGAADSYDFSHDKLRQHVYTSLSTAHRRQFHRRVALAFEHVYAHNLDTISGQIAVHYERAGLSEKAISNYRRAAEAALHIYAHTEAIPLLLQAIALIGTHRSQDEGKPHPYKSHWQEAATIFTMLGDIYAQTGRLEDARHSYHHALAALPPQQPIWQARLLRKTAGTWNLASDNPLDTFHINAHHTFQQAQDILDQAQDTSDTAWQQEWIQLHLDQLFPLRGTADEMTAIIERTRPVIEHDGTAEQQGKFFQAVIARDSRRDRYTGLEHSLAYRRKMLHTIQQTNNKDLIGFGHFVLGNGLLFSDQLHEAEEQMRIALQIAEHIGSTPLLVRSLAFLGVILRRRGHIEKLRPIIARALALPEARNIPPIKGNQAWLAWLDGNIHEAEIYGKASLDAPTNAFRWIGLWPLLAIMLAQNRLPEAIHYATMLLDTTQQTPPDALSTPLHAALHAWQQDTPHAAHASLQQAVTQAQAIHYL